MNVLCIYHQNDLDGVLSAALVNSAYSNVQLYPYTYSGVEKYFPSEHEDGILINKIFMVDISYPHDSMLRLKQECENRSIELIWIDHHISAINDSKNFGYDDIEGIRWNLKEERYNVGACFSVWEYLLENTNMIDIRHNENVDKFIRILATYDGWDEKLNLLLDTYNTPSMSWRTILGIQEYYNMRFMDYPTHTDTNDSVLDMTYYLTRSKCDDIDDIINIRSKDVLIHKEFVYNNIYKNASFNTIILGHKTLAINAPLFSSTIFNANMDSSIELMMVFNFDPKSKKYRVSFYSKNKDVDCSKIAAIFGGGGHPGAAGCFWSIAFMQNFLENGELKDTWEVYA